MRTDKPIEMWTEVELQELAVPEHSPRYHQGGFLPPPIDEEVSTVIQDS